MERMLSLWSTRLTIWLYSSLSKCSWKWSCTQEISLSPLGLLTSFKTGPTFCLTNSSDKETWRRLKATIYLSCVIVKQSKFLRHSQGSSILWWFLCSSHCLKCYQIWSSWSQIVLKQSLIGQHMKRQKTKRSITLKNQRESQMLYSNLSQNKMWSSRSTLTMCLRRKKSESVLCIKYSYW